MDLVKRGEVWLVAFDPTVGSEIRKTRPALIVSPDELNIRLNTLIVVPLTSKSRPAPFRIDVSFEGKSGLILLDQVRTVSRQRLRKSLGVVEPEVLASTLRTLSAMFGP